MHYCGHGRGKDVKAAITMAVFCMWLKMPKMLLYEAKISERKLSWVKDYLEKQETGGI